MAGNGYFEYLDSQKLLDAAKKIDTNIVKYQEIIRNVNKVSNDLISSWRGEGRNEFEKDYNVIYRQMEDINDIMLDLYNALVDSDASYVQGDENIAKSLNMGEYE